MLKVDLHSAPAATTLVCDGRIVLGVEAETLRCLALSRAERRIVLDLSGISSIDAAGLGLLVELHCHAVERAGTLTLANPSARVQQLLELTRLHSVLDVCEDAGASLARRTRSDQRAMTA